MVEIKQNYKVLSKHELEEDIQRKHKGNRRKILLGLITGKVIRDVAVQELVKITSNIPIMITLQYVPYDNVPRNFSTLHYLYVFFEQLGLIMGRQLLYCQLLCMISVISFLEEEKSAAVS